MDVVAPGSVSQGSSVLAMGNHKGKKGFAVAASAAAAAATTTASTITKTSSSGMTSVQVGVWLSLLIMSLYFYGLSASIYSLPDISTQLEPPKLLFGNDMTDEKKTSTTTTTTKVTTTTKTSAGGDASSSKVVLMTATALARNLNVALDMYQESNATLFHNNNNNGVVKRTYQAKIPRHVFPDSMTRRRQQQQQNDKNQQDDYEAIIHPGDGVTTLLVPPFWSPPIHQGGLMTRQVALSIGSCSVPVFVDHNNNNNNNNKQKDPVYARGDDCPVDDRTIYFAIASYRDFQCRYTVESAFLRAKNPKRIRVGIVDQITKGVDPPCNEPIEPCETNPHQALCLYQDQVDVYTLDADLSIGPVFARHIGHRLYRGEYYYTQSDAHVSYTQNWDADIIKQMEATNNEMAVLTTYLTDVQGSISEEGHSLRNTRPIMCNTDYEGGPQGMHLRHGSQPERVPSIQEMSQMQPYWAAGYSFSRGHFVVNVPYDLYQPMIFQGEEMSIGIRGFTVGYDFYAPQRSVCFHHYAVGKNKQLRNKVPHFWEHENHYAGIGKKAMQRLLGIVHMNPEIDPSEWNHAEEDVYGLGGVRTPEKFYQTFGIDVVNKKTQHHLCQFVDKGVMHRDFQKLLRPDGMGVDYDLIDYEFTDPSPE